MTRLILAILLAAAVVFALCRCRRSPDLQSHDIDRWVMWGASPAAPFDPRCVALQRRCS